MLLLDQVLSLSLKLPFVFKRTTVISLEHFHTLLSHHVPDEFNRRTLSAGEGSPDASATPLCASEEAVRCANRQAGLPAESKRSP